MSLQHNVTMFKTLERVSAAVSEEARRCEAKGCQGRTREGKPYCPDHVDEHGYVQRLIEVIARREREEERVRRQGVRAVDPTGLNAREILLQLDLYGARTAERISRDLQMDVETVRSYMRALARKGWVTLGETSRHALLATPVAGRPWLRELEAPEERKRRRRSS